MPIEDDYKRQLLLLSKTSDEIESMQKKIKADGEDYKRQIGSMRAAGFMGTYTDRLNERYVIFARLIDEMLAQLDQARKNIEDKHKVVVGNRMRAAEEAARQTGG